MKKLLTALTAIGVVASGAFAASTAVAAPSFDYTSITNIAGALVGALAVLWVIRRAVHLLGK